MKKITKFFAKVGASMTGFFALAQSVYAKAAWEPDEGPSQTSLDELIRTGLNTAIIIAAVVAVFFLIYNGFKYMMAGGDTGKTEEAQKGLANALIGLVVCIAAALVVNFVLSRFGMETKGVDQAVVMLMSSLA
ncbi:hypothetical protein JW887_06610 [Candidatus Dojkabacteria bacterium]|nr:hypothetical protein [Candidatus Dojkabacteria bacterium]